MTYKRFEDLPVWQAAMRLAEDVHSLIRHRPLRALRALCDQLQRAALSVSNNIAEGFERGTTAELLSFLYIARGSAGEVRSMLIFADRLLAKQDGAESQPSLEISDLKSQISETKGLAESCSRQLRAWVGHLQDSDIEGHRRLNDRTRNTYDAKRRADAFLRHLQQIRDDAQDAKTLDAESREEEPR